MSALPIRRSELTCPGHSLKMMTKAAASDADEVIFDLEDACAVPEKVGARAAIAQAMQTLDFTGGKVRAYRINGVETPWCYRDLVDVLEPAGARVQVVVIPKVKSPDEVTFVDRLVTQIERAKGFAEGAIALEVLIETAAGLSRALEIARASPRVASLIFGVADFAGDLGAGDFRENDGRSFDWARQQLLLAARTAGVDAIDSVTVELKDPARVAKDAAASARLGFDGKWAIHPSQVAPIQSAFTPTPEQLARAKTIVDAYRRSDAAGKGALLIDGEMVDAATLRVEERRLAVAQRAGLTA
ncbi:MAG: CoA ester lyase [Myxococcaceae bacterium]|nr:CoA ester lyase [Myxococcaceae bacterium]